MPAGTYTFTLYAITGSANGTFTVDSSFEVVIFDSDDDFGVGDDSPNTETGAAPVIQSLGAGAPAGWNVGDTFYFGGSRGIDGTGGSDDVFIPKVGAAWQTDVALFSTTEATTPLVIGQTYTTNSPASIQNETLPNPVPDFIVGGTVGDDSIDSSYVGDPEGDLIDNLDHSDSSDADSVQAGAGNDTVLSGADDDTVDGGAGDDFVNAGSGADSVDGGLGDDSILGLGDNDTLNGDAGSDTIDGGAGADSIDGGGDNDSIFGGNGNDTLIGGSGDDTIEGGNLNDSILGGAGNDTIDGGSGNDSIVGGTGNDSISTGTGADTVDGGAGNDTISANNDNNVLGGGADADLIQIGISDGDTITGGEAGDDNDTLSGAVADDTLTITLTGDEVGTYTDDDGDSGIFSEIEAFELTSGDDIFDGSAATTAGATVDAGAGEDSITGTGADDSLLGGSGDDTILFEDGFGNDTIIGGELSETNGDTLDLSNVTDALAIDLSDANAENGTVSDGTDTASFAEIENIVLGSGADTLVLADGGGDDTVAGFDVTDSGDGTAVDQLDVSALTSDGGTTPVTTDDVIVTDTNGDGTGDAILTFPGGESITLIGVSPADVDDQAELMAIGIPAPLNYIVEGGAGDDTINGSYTGDPEGDMIDASDNLLGNNDDSIVAGAGNDSVVAGLGNDTIDAGDGNDTVLGGSGNDSIDGGIGDDNIMAENGNDTINAGDGDDTVGASIGADLIDGGAGNDSLSGGGLTSDAGDTIFGGTGNDTISGGSGDDSLFGNEDDDSLSGDTGNDTLEGGDGNDTVIGGDGNDSLIGGAGDDSIVGGAGDDFLRGSFGEDTIIGGTGEDTLWGGFGDDSLVIDADFGDYTIEGEEVDETLGDTMDVSGVEDDLTWDLTNPNPEAGSFTDGTNTANYVDIENIILGGGTDTLTLSTFGGSNTVSAFSAPTDTGGGTFSGNDQLDVSGLLDVDGNPTHTGNVTVTEVGGSAVLTFPNGETLTLVGVPAADVNTPAQLIAMGIPEGPDGFVDGTAGNDTIDVNYTGDPNFDRVDNNDAILPGAADNDDFIRAGAGDDSVLANAGDDTVEGGTGNDTLEGGGGNDTLSGEADDDSLVGGLGDDSLIGGAGDDTLNGQIGDDVLEGGDGSDSFALEDDFGNDTIIGGEVDDAAGDTLDMSGVGGAISYDLTGVDAEAGTVTDGTGTITFSEIENITLSSGLDTIVLDNGSGDDVVNNFTAPILAGDGSYFGADQLDVSTMIDGNGAPVNTGDVIITDTVGDGSGDTILTFPGGETLTLVGILPSAFPTPEALAAIGIPLADYIVEGTAAGDVIDGSYLGDPEGDIVDANDAENGSDDDIIEAGAGADTVTAGDGNDSVFADEGDDIIDAGAGNDTVFAGDDNDTISGGTGDDSLIGQAGTDSISGDAGDDLLEGGTGDDTLFGGADNDTLLGGDDNDSLEGGSGNDSLLGGAGDDTLNGGTGNDQIEGGFGDDTFLLTDNFGDDVVDGEADFETNGDTLDASGVTAEGVSIVYTNDEVGTLAGAITGDEADFFDIENIVATDNADTIDATLDTLGVNADAGDGDDLVTGGSGVDTIDGGAGNDTISGGTGGDSITAGAGDDTINVAQGDTVTGGDGDDFFNIVDLAEADTDVITIVGGEGDETNGDTLALNGLHGGNAINIIDPDDVNGGLSGNVTLLDGTVINFTNIENIICFVPGTEIATPFGARMIEDLKVGDEVATQDNGIQRIRWIGQTTVPASGNFAPVRFNKSTFPGADGDLVVSPQHRMLFKGYAAELLFGESEVLIPAIHLLDGINVTRDQVEMVTYIHIMFEQHEIIFAQGVPTESFHPGSFGVDSLAPQAREELFTLFPSLRSDLSVFGQSARTSLKGREARALLNF